MEEGAEIVKLYELHYSDLVSMSSPNVSSFSIEENEKLFSTTRAIMDALGPNGPGLIAIVGVPNSSLRRSLLPLARSLTLLNPDHRKRILKEHNLGSDVSLKNPERNVSSFAMQLKYRQNLDCTRNEEDDPSTEKDEFKNLGNYFEQLGSLMMDLGLDIARICDRSIGGQELEKSLLESGSAKGRLIHYHSSSDKMILSKDRNGRGNPKNQSNSSNMSILKARSNLWQQWHYDYGIFTILTSPMFVLPSPDESTYLECDSLSGHTHLQIFDPSRHENNIRKISAPPDSFIVQVGESGDIISKGKLRSTLHSVSRPTEMEDLCRETFVVFLQPAWDKSFSIPDYFIKNTVLDKKEIMDEIVPPLRSRLKNGMTFAQFSCETTKQYYGGRGLQSIP